MDIFVSLLYLCVIRFLVDEGKAGQPKMMTVGLHCRLSRPGRVAALESFVDYAKSYGRDVWICTREEIANHWYENHLPRGVGNPIKPSTFTSASSGTPWSGVGNTYSPAPSSFSNSASKFSYLGNLTTPRESVGTSDHATSPIKAASQVPDGDII